MRRFVDLHTHSTASDGSLAPEELVVQADLAGLQRGSIEVYIDDQRLLIRGSRPDPGRGGRTHFHKLEIPDGPFERWIALPENVDPVNARARYENGFLLVTIPFGESEPGARRSIEIDS